MNKKQYFVKVKANAPGNRLCEKIKEDVIQCIDTSMKEFSRCRKPVLSAHMVGGVGEGLHPQLALMKANNDGTAVFVINTDTILRKVEFNNSSKDNQ